MERVEIVCPCGVILVKEAGDPRRELACPACQRINVLPDPGPDGAAPGATVAGREAQEAGKTTQIHSKSPAAIQAGSVVGPYEVTGLIGEGGMGKVYTAVDRSLQRTVALKVLSGQLQEREDFVARFRREARSVARLNHPNIVQIYFTGTHDDRPYYAMEWVDGNNLEQVLQSEGPLDPDRAVDLMTQAAEGLSAAAVAGVIHRDVKPSNMVLSRSGVLKITDFGLAKTISSQSHVTMTGTIVGTPYYMSPEQGEGKEIDHRADIYSLGASMYHLLVGAPPFEAASPISIILKHINERLEPLEERDKKIPASLSAIVAKMMAKTAVERYRGYEELIGDLEAFRQGHDPRALSWRERLGRLGGTQSAPEEPRKTRSFVIEEEEKRKRPPEEIHLKRCGLVRRGLAFVLDLSLLSALYSIKPVGLDREVWDVTYLSAVFLYLFLADSRGGKTLGKMVFRCRVGREDGEDLGLFNAFVRSLLVILVLFGLAGIPVSPVRFAFSSVVNSSLVSSNDALIVFDRICIVWLFIDGAVLLFNSRRRALHDLLSSAYLFVKLRAVKEKRKKEKNDARRKKERAAIERKTARSVPKDPLLAAILSTVLPGLGQIYNGEFFKGLLILFTCWLILPYLYGIYNAYTKARQINRDLTGVV